MTQRFVSRGFIGKRREPAAGTAHRIPPGQHEVKDFPVLSAGPTPRVNLGQWTFTIEGLVRQPAHWSRAEFSQLPAQSWMVDIHCVT
jgi:DMSO/TMAO reductase YedYZ molybdopterin-dependent catalytic subunit